MSVNRPATMSQRYDFDFTVSEETFGEVEVIPVDADAYERGVAAGRKQAAADAETQWGWLSADGKRVYLSPSEADAREAASRSGAKQLMRRYITPWEPVEEGQG